jgi:hypothetical protein
VERTLAGAIEAAADEGECDRLLCDESDVVPVGISADHARELVSEWFLRAEAAGRARPLRSGDLFERYPHEVQGMLKSHALIRESVRIPALPLKAARVDPRSGPSVTIADAAASMMRFMIASLPISALMISLICSSASVCLRRLIAMSYSLDFRSTAPAV